MSGFPKFDCPSCGKSVASQFREAIFQSVRQIDGSRFSYAYLRAHKGWDGQPCPAWHTGPLAAVTDPGHGPASGSVSGVAAGEELTPHPAVNGSAATHP